MAPVFATRQQQTAHVQAGGQQHQRRQHQQDHYKARYAGLQRVIDAGERIHVYPPARGNARKLVFNFRGERVEGAIDCRDTHAGTHTAEQLETLLAPRPDLGPGAQLIHQGHRNEDLGRKADEDAAEPLGQHADDGERNAVEEQRGAHKVGITAAVALPEAVAHNGHGGCRANFPIGE